MVELVQLRSQAIRGRQPKELYVDVLREILELVRSAPLACT
jgi:hypothetical protein